MSNSTSKRQIDIRVTRTSDEELFNYLSSGKGIERLRELYQQNKDLKVQNQKLVDEINKHKNTLVGIRLSSRQAQNNSDVMLGIFNTWLFHQTEMTPISLQEKKHPLINYFESEHRKMLDNIAQRKVYGEKITEEKIVDHTPLNIDDEDPF